MLTAVFFVTGKLVTPLSAFAGTLSDVVEQEIYAYESKFADKKEILRYFYRDSIKTGFNNYNFVDGGGIVISQI